MFATLRTSRIPLRRRIFNLRVFLNDESLNSEENFCILLEAGLKLREINFH